MKTVKEYLEDKYRKFDEYYDNIDRILKEGNWSNYPVDRIYKTQEKILDMYRKTIIDVIIDISHDLETYCEAYDLFQVNNEFFLTKKEDRLAEANIIRKFLGFDFFRAMTGPSFERQCFYLKNGEVFKSIPIRYVVSREPLYGPSVFIEMMDGELVLNRECFYSEEDLLKHIETQKEKERVIDSMVKQVSEYL